MSIGCRDLRVHAGHRLLLEVDDLHVASGSALAVLGANGAGKSTLLRALGLLSPHRVTGEVLLDGAPATRPGMRGAAAAVLQRPILRRGSVLANVASGLRFRGVRRREARSRAAHRLDALGVAHLAAHDVRELSGGEAQRVSVARALAVEPRVLLLDEPFTGLDAATRADLVADLRVALDGRHTATVLVTHDLHEAAALARDVAVLVGGRIRRRGDLAQVLDDPRDPETARLLGWTNVVCGLVARPEHTRLVGDGDGDGVRVSGRLRRVVPLGPATRVDVDIEDGTVTCLYPYEAAVGTLPTPGSAVTVVLTRTRATAAS
jgi:tungstate transport system ATP-binding protein